MHRMRVCICGPKGLPDGGRSGSQEHREPVLVSPPRGSKTVECLPWPGHPDVDGRDEQRMGERFRCRAGNRHLPSVNCPRLAENMIHENYCFLQKDALALL